MLVVCYYNAKCVTHLTLFDTHLTGQKLEDQFAKSDVI